MSEKYMNRFRVTELFDKNKYQEIHMATNKLNAETIAVINTLNRNTGLDETFLKQARVALKGLIHSEITSDSLILVTQHCDGQPLADWLKSKNNFTDDDLFEFTNQYLNQILSYEQFDSYFTTMLADVSQIVMKNDQLCMSEMIFIDDRITPFIIPATDFSAVAEKVREVLEVCITAQNNPNGHYSLMANAFVKNVLSDASSLADLQRLWNLSLQEDLEKTRQIGSPIDSNGTPVSNFTEDGAEDRAENEAEAGAGATESASESSEKVSTALESQESENETLIELDALRERKPTNKRHMGFLILAAAIVLGIAAFLLMPHLTAKSAPTASYTWVKQADGVLKFTNTSKVIGDKNSIATSEWKIYSHDKEIYTCSSFNMAIGLKTSGDYKVTLRVMDNNKNWSKPYSETLSYEAVKLVPLKDSGISNGDETLSNFKITFDTPNIFEDTQVFNTGNKSLRLELGKNGKATFSLKELNTPSNYVISMWMKTSQLGQFDISLNGMKNGHSRFNEHLLLNPESTEAWQMVELRITNKDIDALSITVKGSGNLWIDDIQIGEIK